MWRHPVQVWAQATSADEIIDSAFCCCLVRINAGNIDRVSYYILTLEPPKVNRNSLNISKPILANLGQII